MAPQGSRPSQIASLFNLLENEARRGRWLGSVHEHVTPSDHEIVRRVVLTIKREELVDPAGSNYLVLHRPLKGTYSKLGFSAMHASRARVLTYQEHTQIARGVLFLRTLDVYRSAQTDASESLALRLVEKLATVPRIATMGRRNARKKLRKLRQSDVIKAVNRRPAMREPLSALWDECSRLAESYMVVVEVAPDTAQDELQVEYETAEQTAARPFGPWKAVKDRLNAPPHALRLEVPLARRCPHYLFTMDALPGYYVGDQRALQADGRKSDRYAKERSRGEAFWSEFGEEPLRNITNSSIAVIRDSGVVTAPRLFIGDGHQSKKEIHIGVRFIEAPPGASGVTLLTTATSLAVALPIVLWAYGSSVTSDPSAAGALISAILGIGAGAVERTIPRAALVNAPLAPRVVLYVQSVLLMLLSVWLLAHHSPLYDRWPWSMSGVRLVNKILNHLGGGVILGTLAGLLVYLGVRYRLMVKRYQHRLRLAQNRK